MNQKRKAVFYVCPLGHGNRTSRKCACGMICRPIYEEDISERNWENDPTYLDYILKKNNDSKKDDSK